MENEMWEAAIGLGSALALKQAALRRTTARSPCSISSSASRGRTARGKSDADEAAATAGGAGGSAAAPANLDALGRQAKAHYEAAAAVLQKRVDFLEAPPADGAAAAAAEAEGSRMSSSSRR